MKDRIKPGKQNFPGSKHGFRAVDFPFLTPEYKRRVRRCLVENRGKVAEIDNVNGAMSNLSYTAVLIIFRRHLLQSLC